MKIVRHKTKVIKIGNLKIGGNNPIAIQSMAKVDTKDISGVIREIKTMEKAGCEIVRLAVKDRDEASAVKQIKKKINIPLVADIHFDYSLALLAIKNGVDKIRLNPGNIYKKDQIRSVVVAAKKARIPIRVGVNSGSVRKSKSTSRNKNIMVESALSYIKVLEGFGFYDIVVSLKASTVLETICAYREFSKRSNYPLHLGITATGSIEAGMVKSSLAIGALLLGGIGDTFRVSLTTEPQKEIKLAKQILQALNLRNFTPEIISCPTCGRCEVDLEKIVKELECRILSLNSRLPTRPVKLAVMGCVVNGPGEAKEADIGIAFGKNEGLLFKKGSPVRKVKQDRAAKEIIRELREF